MDHTQHLPWRYEEPSFGKPKRTYADVFNSQGVQMFFLMDLEDARRIVAAVNACAGMETGWLEEHGAGGWTQMLNDQYEEGFAQAQS